MANNCKYYKQQRYVSYNSGVTWQPLEQYQMGELYEQNSPDCGDSSVDYRWVSVENGYMCDGKNRYGKEMQQITYDGIYWYNVFPTVYRKGSLIESNSPLCDNAGQGQYDSGGTDPTSGETSGDTQCPKGYTWNGSECICGTVLDSDGKCVICADNEYFDTDSNECRCKGNYVNGICQNCGIHSHFDANSKKCVCNVGYGGQNCTAPIKVDPLKITKCESEDGILTQEEVNYYYNYTPEWTLLSYQVGDCITEIGESAFNGHIALTSVTIPDSVVQIDRLAFANCRSLPNITIPSGVTTYGDNMFVHCDGLTNVDFRGNITSVPLAMFAYCNNLQSIDWLTYNNITTIGNKAFLFCEGLTSVSFNSYLNTIGDEAFEGCRGLKQIDIPSGVTTIGKFSFALCTELTSVTINSSATTIGNQAFLGCKKLLKIIFTTETPPTIATDILGNDINCSFIVPCNAVETYKTAWPQYAEKITCTDVEYYYRWIGEELYCEAYDEYTREKKQQSSDNLVWTDVIPQEYRIKEFITHYSRNCGYSGEVALTVVGSDGYTRYYEPCSGSDVTISNEITSGANVSAATEITLGSCVTAIGTSAFTNCNLLTYFEIPSGVTSIGQYAFSECRSLSSITIPDNVISIGRSSFYNCTSLSSITISDNVTSIGNYAFYNCHNMKTVEIGSGITSIYPNAFNLGPMTSSSAESITIKAEQPPTCFSSTFDNSNDCPIYVPPFSVTAYKLADGWSYYASRIQSIPFKVASNQNGIYKSVYCNSSTTLTSTEARKVYSLAYHNDIVIGDCVTVIGSLAFMNAKMSSVTISNTVTTIRNAAFYECTELSSITIPNSVTLISGGAFYNCSSLTGITVEATTPATLGSNAFDNTNDCPIYVPAESVNAYKSASGWSYYASRIQAM